MVSYEYDAYGKLLNKNGSAASTVGIYNPFRYKGYYYDVETQLFYCNSRYYSPELCRFISPDSIEYLDPESINGLNLYCYCMNNPISYIDPSGNLPQWAKWAIGAGVIAILAVATVLTAGAAGVGVGAAFAAGFAGSAIGVGASGLAVTIAGSAFAGAVIGAGFGLIGGALVGGISSGSWSVALEGAANGFMMGSITGAISGSIRGGINYARTSPLIRSVNTDELNSIKSTGQFSSSGHSETKWFATNSTDASKWANWFGQSDYVGIRVPKSAFKNFYFDPVLDYIGPAYNIEIGYLNSLLKGIWYF